MTEPEALANINLYIVKLIYQLIERSDTSLLFFPLLDFCFSCSSLSVFALHPLYLRVQALSERLPEEIKVILYTYCILEEPVS